MKLMILCCLVASAAASYGIGAGGVSGVSAVRAAGTPVNPHTQTAFVRSSGYGPNLGARFLPGPGAFQAGQLGFNRVGDLSPIGLGLSRDVNVGFSGVARYGLGLSGYGRVLNRGFVGAHQGAAFGGPLGRAGLGAPLRGFGGGLYDF